MAALEKRPVFDRTFSQINRREIGIEITLNARTNWPTVWEASLTWQV